MGIPFLPFLLGLSGDSRRVEESAQTATYSLSAHAQLRRDNAADCAV